MKLDITKDLLQKDIPSNSWLVKDTNPQIIRSISTNVQNPEQLTSEEENCMQRLIDFTRYSQDEVLNHSGNADHLRPAVGLAAPQIGLNKNMFFVRVDWGNNEIEEYAMINAEIISKSSQMTALEDGEGCLSVDHDWEGIVPRHYKIIVRGYDYLAHEYVELKLRSYVAIVFQHELEHNIGKLYYDRIDKDKPNHIEDDWILI
ncbi:peptide deformylase [Williamsoniiplasma somnilux]|uniref:Peptide deformylase n=1 Tax=Williamsoniiplasma somnilux TaxID=215578 RepID=A0A2K8P119_9MOLU|nr:peptide deformylase [Williamsoniiplasma somnilux]ATZ18593.1 peptide deformylase [Williamsoniiplasma somnilux]